LKFEKGEETELKKFEDILAQCIEDIKAGRASIEDCLDRYPSMREQLEPLLRIALEIREPPDVKPSSSFKVKARVQLMDQIHGRQAVTKWPWSRYNSQMKPIPYIRRFSMARVIVAAVAISLAVLAVLGVVYWTPGTPEQPLGTGTLKLYLSDAPLDAENVTGVYITINEIQYHLGRQWITCEEFEGPKKYNLLELTGGNITLLGEFALPAGNYTQIRFMLDIPEMGSHKANPGCYIEFADNSTEPLFVPSGGETGYKATGRFEVTANETVEVTADFDVRKAVVVAGSSYILNPTIRLIVNSQAGSISGSITNSSNYTDIIVFAYEDGTWREKETNEPAGQKSRFPDAITSGKMDEEGGYNLALLAAGTYDLVVAGYNGADFGEVLGFISNVQVQSKKATIQNIDTDALEASP